MNLRIKGQAASPPVRFKSFPDQWKAGEVGQYASLVGGLTYTPADVAPEGLLVLRSSNVQNGVIELKDNVFVTLQVSEDALSQPEDILVCVRNGSRNLIGKTALLPEGLPQSTHGAFMSVIRGEHNRFLFQLLQTSRYHRQVHINLGATINSINGSALKAFQFYFPTLPEQQKIADFLTAVDGRIGQLIQKKFLLEDYKKGVMHQLFTQAIRFKDDHGNDFPDWEEKKLGSLGATYGGLSGKAGEDFGSGKPYVTYSQIFDRTAIDLSKCKHVQIKPKEKQNRVKKGDILFTTSSETRLEVGYTSVVLDEPDEVYLNSFCFGFRLNENPRMLTKFARYLFHSTDVRRSIAVLGQGSTRYNLSKNELMKIVLLLPSTDEQIKIADFLSALDRKIESVATQITETRTFKRGLLQQMFV